MPGLFLGVGVTTIAALYVDPRGCYAGLPGVDVWDEQRDARRYAGPHPVVAHPPCSRWCRLAGLVEARYPHLRGQYKGNDGGAFAAALDAVRTWGGVLEHPAASRAWAAHGLAAPPSSGGWIAADWHGGWTCHVEQGHYGHRSNKATWLYACHVSPASLTWGPSPGARKVVEKQSKRERNATPPAFRDVLLSMARGVQR